MNLSYISHLKTAPPVLYSLGEPIQAASVCCAEVLRWGRRPSAAQKFCGGGARPGGLLLRRKMGNKSFALPSAMRTDPALTIDCDFKGAPKDRDAAAAIDAAAEALTALDHYTPNPEPIRAAISSPSDPGIAVTCATALFPNVEAIAGWHGLAALAAKEIDRLSDLIAKTAAPPAPPLIASDPSRTTALAKLVHFCWKFDQGKLMQPGVQNDFAGYRRVVGKVPADTDGLTVGEAQTNEISMWRKFI